MEFGLGLERRREYVGGYGRRRWGFLNSDRLGVEKWGK